MSWLAYSRFTSVGNWTNLNLDEVYSWRSYGLKIALTIWTFVLLKKNQNFKNYEIFKNKIFFENFFFRKFDFFWFSGFSKKNFKKFENFGKKIKKKFFLITKKNFFFEVKKNLRPGSDAEKPYLSIGAIFRAIRAT